MADGGVIGRAGGLPWRVSSDLKRFKAMTMGKPVVMGRKCYESIGKPLPGRPNIVISRNPDFRPEGVTLAHSLEEALGLARELGWKTRADEICVIGGGEIYRQSLEIADLLHVTHILGTVEGDTFYPEIDPAVWEVAHAENVPQGERDDFPSRFVTYRRHSSR